MHERVVTTTLVDVVVELRDCAGILRFDRRRWLSVKCVFLLRVFFNCFLDQLRMRIFCIKNLLKDDNCGRRKLKKARIVVR